MKKALSSQTGLPNSPWTNQSLGARLNVISHLLSKIDYEDLPCDKVKLPKRQQSGGYQEPDHPINYIPQVF